MDAAVPAVLSLGQQIMRLVVALFRKGEGKPPSVPYPK